MINTYDEKSLPYVDLEPSAIAERGVSNVKDGVLTASDKATLVFPTSPGVGVLDLGLLHAFDCDVHTACWGRRLYRCLDPQRLRAGTVYVLVLFEDGYCTFVGIKRVNEAQHCAG